MTVDRRTLAAIHIAKKDRGLDDDTYRDLLQRIAGVRSAADLDQAGARRVMAEFERLGFRNTARRVRHDDRPIARKVVALWLMLWNLDEVASRKDKSIDAFVKRTTGKEALRFTTNGEAGKVVEALKAWCHRASVELDRHEAEPLRLLIRQQWNRLLPVIEVDIVPLDALTHSELLALANELGTEVRRLKLGSRHQYPSSTQGAENARTGQSQSEPDLG